MRKTLRLGAMLVALACAPACGDDDDDDAGKPDGGAQIQDGGGQRSDAGRLDAGRNDAGKTEDDAGDDDDGGTSSSGPFTTLHLEGHAEGTADGGSDRVDCRFDAVFDQIVRKPNGDFSAFATGELFRTTTVGEMQYEFAPFIGGPVSLKHTGGSTVELRFVGDQPDDALEFWKELEAVTGEDQRDGHYAGEWTCAPGLLGNPGFGDIDLSVPGTWTIEPGM